MHASLEYLWCRAKAKSHSPPTILLPKWGVECSHIGPHQAQCASTLCYIHDSEKTGSMQSCCNVLNCGERIVLSLDSMVQVLWIKTQTELTILFWHYTSELIHGVGQSTGAIIPCSVRSLSLCWRASRRGIAIHLGG